MCFHSRSSSILCQSVFAVMNLFALMNNDCTSAISLELLIRRSLIICDLPHPEGPISKVGLPDSARAPIKCDVT